MNFVQAILEVSDLEKSLAFYRDIVGMPLLRMGSGPVGAQMAFLGEEGKPMLELLWKGRQVTSVPDAGIALGFFVESAEDVIHRAGGDAQGPIPMGPEKQFYYIHDPDGYRVQLIERRKEQ